MHATAVDRCTARSRERRSPALLLLGLASLLLPPQAGAEPGGSWLARAQEHIAAREYHATPSGGSLQAPNRAHGLRTWFEPSGVRVVDRVAPGRPTLVELALVRAGRAGAMAAVPPGTVWHEAARIEIRREGLVEWYRNSPDGLEQGVNLPKRPEGEGELVVEYTVSSARVSGTSERLRLHTAAGRKLAFAKLRVEDVAGTRLPARFALTRGGYRVVVDDRGAVYPVVVDPLLTESFDAELESNQVNARLGTAVASAGDVNGDGFADVIIGASEYDNGETDEGAAFVFLGSATGLADGNPLNAHALIESNQADARLGASVDSAGDVNGDGYADIVVGSGRYDNGEVDEGIALVFHGSATGIADGDPTTADALIESNQAGANLGGPRGTGDGGVAGAGDVNGDGHADVIVGATGFDGGLTDEGIAAVFEGSAAGIVGGDLFDAIGGLQGNQAEAYLGVVAAAGDVNADGYADALLCAGGFDLGETNEGVAFVMLGGPGGLRVLNGMIRSDEPEGVFDASIACSGAGDVNGDGYADVAVGFDRNDSVQPNAGLVLVVHGSPAGIPDATPATADSVLSVFDAGAVLGQDVASAGDVNSDGYADLIVGAPGYDDTLTDEGAAWVLLGSASGIPGGDVTTTAWAQLPGGVAGAQAGSSVASAGDVDGDGYDDVLVGAREYDGPQTREGQAFLYRGGAIGIQDGNPLTADTQLESDQNQADFGVSVASAGDVNGDGYGDIVIGARGYDAGQGDGAAFVFLGGADGIADSGPSGVHALLESDQSFSGFGFSAASAGDVNGDGYGDVIVGAPSYDAVELDEGAAFVFLGSAAGMPDADASDADTRLESDQTMSGFGLPVAPAGDVNGDGYGDVIVGAFRYDSGEANEGAAFLFLGSDSGISSSDVAGAHARLESNESGASFGRSVASAGDVNGDGYGDVIVGAPDSGASEGSAFVFHGGAAGIPSSGATAADTRLESDQAGAILGLAVASAGDVNGDGFGDVVVGSPVYDFFSSSEGVALVYLGSASGIPNTAPSAAHAVLRGGLIGARLGDSVASAGDVNGDGYGDLVVGAGSYADGEGGEGAAFVVLGSAQGIPGGDVDDVGSRIESDQVGADLGGADGVASAGDVNGDGFGDVVVGARDYSAGQTHEGAAFVFLGNGRGRPLRMQQVRDDGTGTPIPAWGRSESNEGFRVRLTAPTSPRGRERGKLEIEVCPIGVLFEDPGCSLQLSPTWEDLGTPFEFDEAVTGLTAGELYRWRARVLYVPFSADLPGITPPPSPRHGPWYRPTAQAVEADVRVVPEPGAISLATAIAVIGWLRYRRKARSSRRLLARVLPGS